MGVYFLLALHLLVLETLASSCLPREYPINNLCCPMCNKGSFVKSYCTPESSSSVCVICADGTYTDHPNGLTACFRCRECDPGAGLIMTAQCTTDSNTVCECKAGHFCLNQDCDFCQEYKKCQPGEYVKTPGTLRTDAVCEKCPPHHFSNKSNSADCLPWQECSKLGLVLYKEGTSTADSICKEKRRHEWVYASLILCPLIIAISIIIKCLPSSKHEKTAPEVEQGSSNTPLSREEVPI